MQEMIELSKTSSIPTSELHVSFFYYANVQHQNLTILVLGCIIQEPRN
jgi:hypothetical protein